MENLYLTLDEVEALIRSGAVVAISGSEQQLAALPKGKWIGGTTAYFMTEAGGVVDAKHLFCQVIREATDCRISVFTPETLPHLNSGRYANGFTYLLVPAFSETHRQYALQGPSFPGLFDQPVIGWITGVHLSDLGKVTPKVYDGQSGQAYENAAVALFVQLPEKLMPEIDIINLFTVGNGPAITFPKTDFSASDCEIDGQPANLAEYIVKNSIDSRLPLVANYAGAMINSSVQAVDGGKGDVQLYAPVVAGEIYRFAQPVDDFASAYASGGAMQAGKTLSCNCILNFLYAGLEGNTAGGFVGPVTFGEVAYILLNQTLATLRIVEVTSDAEPGQIAEALI